MTHPSSVVVIGIGSPFGVDQLGWQVVERLKQQPSLFDSKRVSLQSCDRPGTLLLDYLNGADTAFLIDAIEGGIAGQVRIIKKTQLFQHPKLHSSHDLGVAETIALGDKLDLLPNSLFIIGIETGYTSNSSQLSDEQLSDETVKHIIDIVNEHTLDLVVQ